MKEIYTKELERFDEEFFYLLNLKVNHYNEKDYEKAQILQELCNKTSKNIKNFLIQSHINILKEEIKELEEMKRVEKIEIKTKEDTDPIDGQTITIPYDQEECRKLIKKATLQDTITHLLKRKEELKELIK